jgi:hypothetical protein
VPVVAVERPKDCAKNKRVWVKVTGRKYGPAYPCGFVFGASPTWLETV